MRSMLVARRDLPRSGGPPRRGSEDTGGTPVLRGEDTAQKGGATTRSWVSRTPLGFEEWVGANQGCRATPGNVQASLRDAESAVCGEGVRATHGSWSTMPLKGSW
jgi:hypothetical protein